MKENANIIEDVQHKIINVDNLFLLNIDDPGNWDKFSQDIRDFLVERVQLVDILMPWIISNYNKMVKQ